MTWAPKAALSRSFHFSFGLPPPLARAPRPQEGPGGCPNAAVSALARWTRLHRKHGALVHPCLDGRFGHGCHVWRNPVAAPMAAPFAYSGHFWPSWLALLCDLAVVLGCEMGPPGLRLPC